MDLRSVYITNGIGIFLLLILYYVSRARTSRDRLEDRLYSFMSFGVMLGCVSEVLSYVIDGKTFVGARALLYAFNTYIFSANMLLPFCLLVYIDLCLYHDKGRIWKRYKPQIIIGAIMIAVNVVNFFVPISYVLNEQNMYERRPFSYAYYVVIVYYCLSIIFLLRRYQKENGAQTFFRFGMFLIPVIIGIGLQFVFYGLSLAWLSSSIGLLGLFMMQQNEMAYIDSLVGTYNRQYFDLILTSWRKKGRRFSGVMLDIDNFKSINDNLGHTEGDKVLKDLTVILKQSCLRHEHVFRFAGDEFIILKLTDSPDELEQYMATVQQKLDAYNALSQRPYKLSLSYGISSSSGKSNDDFMKEMDENMYKMKEAHHSAVESNVA